MHERSLHQRTIFTAYYSQLTAYSSQASSLNNKTVRTNNELRTEHIKKILRIAERRLFVRLKKSWLLRSLGIACESLVADVNAHHRLTQVA